MSVLAWILLGLISGYIGSKIVNHRGEGAILDILLGIVGAIAGGYVFQLVGEKGVTGLNLWSLMVATVGSVMLLIVFNAFRRAVSASR
ncbi:MAG: GlsB/YeaQ/YmgE family stress response membrane protein [Deltaproteobacteria bacterium]|nr:GlsB/YeaQ/YmgE family stress response membrane protein [Deltaproteobacteria bacterium]